MFLSLLFCGMPPHLQTAGVGANGLIIKGGARSGAIGRHPVRL